MHLAHLEARLRASEHYRSSARLNEKKLRSLIDEAIDQLNISQAKKDVEPFLRHPEVLQAWSKELFHHAAKKIKVI